MLTDPLSPPEDPLDYRHAPPILVLSFNRPAYLEFVLESLANQVPRIDDRRIHLFQDGAVNAYSGIRYAQDNDIAKCVAIFRDKFPYAHTHVSENNIGIWENFLRAERLAFLTLDAPFAYFFEDDLVLGENYVATLDLLKESFAPLDRIAYFNAFGRYKAPIDVQVKMKDTLVNMGHMWGFALRQSHWKNMQPLLAPYHELVCGRDYRQRPTQEILVFYQKWRISKPESSQDSAKDIVTNVLGCWRASTFVCLAHYIGETGTHSIPAEFAMKGFAKTAIFDQPLTKRFVVDETQIDASVVTIRNLWRAEYERQIGLVGK